MKFYLEISAAFLVSMLFISGSPTPKETVAVNDNVSQASEQLSKTKLIEKKPEKKVKPYSEYGKCLGCYSYEQTDFSAVRKDLVRMIRGYKRYWLVKDIDQVTEVLLFGHNHPHFRINYQVVLAIFGHESWMMIKPPLRTNSNGTSDYGLGQHNSKYYYKRFLKAKKIEAKYDVVKNRTATMDRYDPVTNAIATLVYLRFLRIEIEKHSRIYQRNYKRRDMILAYNAGLTNWKRGNVVPAYHTQVIKNYRYVRRLINKL